MPWPGPRAGAGLLALPVFALVQAPYRDGNNGRRHGMVWYGMGHDRRCHADGALRLEL